MDVEASLGPSGMARGGVWQASLPLTPAVSSSALPARRSGTDPEQLAKYVKKLQAWLKLEHSWQLRARTVVNQ